MERILRLKWYEWIGWLVNIVMAAMAAIFVTLSFLGEELRAALMGLGIAATFIAAWTWVLLFYGKPREAGLNHKPQD
ncbi:MAG: hypothetical protein WCO26_03750 [Deltaproteobacteria bacterium]